jgi:hypothetical protein
MGGIFIIEGMRLSLSNLSLRLDDNGQLQCDGPLVSVSYDACVAWAKIAIAQRDAAINRMATRRSVWASAQASEDDKAHALSDEFATTMQAIVAAATCIDGFYDQIAPFSPVSKETKAAWLKNRTARAVQIAETLRSTFRIKPHEMTPARQSLRALYMLRDASVHPSSNPQAPHQHPELDIATDWRLTTFRGDVADFFVCSAVGMLFDISRGTKFHSEELAKFIDELRKKMDKLLPNGRLAPLSSNITFNLPPKGRQ